MFNWFVRFDGVRFAVFDTANTPGLAHSRVTSLFQEMDGNIWIGHETGELSKLADDRLSHMDREMPGPAVRPPLLRLLFLLSFASHPNGGDGIHICRHGSWCGGWTSHRE